MATEVPVPTLGESVTEATVQTWLKQEGDAVADGETLVELETDKVSIEVPAPAAGRMGKILAPTGSEVTPGMSLCILEDGTAGAASPDAQKHEAPKPAAAPAASPAPTSAPSNTAANTQMPPSPSAQRLLNESGLDPATIPASGPKGNLLKEDVSAAMAKPAPAQSAAAPTTPAAKPPAPSAPPVADYAPAGERPFDPRGEERVKMSKLRKVIATRLKEAQNRAAMLTTFNEVDMGPMMEVRNSYKESFEKKHGAKLGFMSFFVKAAITALKELPAVNAEIYGDEIIYKNYYDIGIAVGTPQGLVVPILRNADSLSFAEIEMTIADFGRRAREGKLTIAEMQGGTFTITNGGVFGSLLSTPIINPPQSGILGMHKIQKRPVVNKKGDIAVGHMMYLAHSYDHRIIDGREAVTFLVRIKDMLEDPIRLLVDV